MPVDELLFALFSFVTREMRCSIFSNIPCRLVPITSFWSWVSVFSIWFFANRGGNGYIHERISAHVAPNTHQLFRRHFQAKFRLLDI